jgi:tRNA (cytidine32/uridine32-2'-O)-methyltransferase
MKNMCLSELYLVRPRRFPHPDTTARASGADDVLAGAVVCDTLAEALAGCSLVFGASARRRTIPWPEVDARGCAAMVAGHRGKAAAVFGREHAGLTNAELEQCGHLVYIPSNPAYSSLNVAAAVQIVAYETMMAADGRPAEVAQEPDDRPATADELEGLYGHFEQALVELGFLDPGNPRQLMRRLRRLFNRAHLEQTEVNILRGILKTAQKRR